MSETLTRDQKFGRIAAILDAIGTGVLPPGHPGLANKYLAMMRTKPATAFTLMHREIYSNHPKFGKVEEALFDILTEEASRLTVEEMTDAPLTGSYYLSYYHQHNALDNVMGAEEAGEMWGLSPGTVRNLCNSGEVKAKLIGKTWVIPKDHPNPKKGKKFENSGEQES